jgi:hypothetical protein
MAETIRFRAEPLRSLLFSSTGAAYVAIGTPLLYPAHLFLIQNMTNALMVFSLDGINDNFVLPANGFFTSDITANQSPGSGGWYLPTGQKIFVKRIGVPTSGSLYLSVFHGVAT